MKPNSYKKKCRVGKRSRAAGFSRFGTATVEMALVAPVVFLLIFGSMEFARLMSVRQALTNAAREGCRKACLATTQNDDDADAVIRTALGGVMRNIDDPDILRISFSPSFDTSPPSGTRITASIEVDSAHVSIIPPFFVQAPIRASSSMNRE
jgi:hypothetical protein